MRTICDALTAQPDEGPACNAPDKRLLGVDSHSLQPTARACTGLQQSCANLPL